MKDWKPIRRCAEAQGWTIRKCSSGHLKWISPDGRVLAVSSSTPSNRKALTAHLAIMRRNGVFPQ